MEEVEDVHELVMMVDVLVHTVPVVEAKAVVGAEEEAVEMQQWNVMEISLTVWTEKTVLMYNPYQNQTESMTEVAELNKANSSSVKSVSSKSSKKVVT